MRPHPRAWRAIVNALRQTVRLRCAGVTLSAASFSEIKITAGGDLEMMRRLGAEFLGTFWLVFGGCGSAVLAAAFPELGIGFLGVSLAFGLTVLTMAYAVGHISGGHFNPAVTIGLTAGGRFPAGEIAPYVDRAGRRRDRRGRRAVRHRQRLGELRSGRRLRLQRLWRALARRLLADLGAAGRDRADRVLPDRDPGCHRQARAGRLRPARDRPGAHADPSGQHSGHEHLGKPGAQHRGRGVRRRLGARSSSGCSGWRRSQAASSAA